MKETMSLNKFECLMRYFFLLGVKNTRNTEMLSTVEEPQQVYSLAGFGGMVESALVSEPTSRPELTALRTLALHQLHLDQV